MHPDEQRLILLYGPPGCGKTTIVDNILKIEDVGYMSVGEITRREIALQTPIGKELKKFLDSVVEYPVPLITNVVVNEIKNVSNNLIILDGYPKYKNETRKFIQNINDNLKGIAIGEIIVIDLSVEDALRRINNRRMCPFCLVQVDVSGFMVQECAKCGCELVVRPDDEVEIFKRRYKDYETSIQETLDQLQVLGVKITHLSGLQAPEVIARDVYKVIKRNKPR